MITFEGNQPVYIQVVELFYMWIVSGELTAGEQIPPVRKLAADLQINPNTVQKSLQILDERGVTNSEVGRGRFITNDARIIAEIKKDVIEHEVENFINRMTDYGLTKKQILKAIEEGIGEPNA